VVDDDEAVRRVLREALSRLGYEIIEAVDGQDCLDKLAAGLRPNVILLDLLMPRKTGADVLRELQQNRNGWPPVIVMSGYFEREDFEGVQAFARFVKPFNIDRIVLAIERALAEQRNP